MRPCNGHAARGCCASDERGQLAAGYACLGSAVACGVAANLLTGCRDEAVVHVGIGARCSRAGQDARTLSAARDIQSTARLAQLAGQ